MKSFIINKLYIPSQLNVNYLDGAIICAVEWYTFKGTFNELCKTTTGIFLRNFCKFDDNVGDMVCMEIYFKNGYMNETV